MARVFARKLLATEQDAVPVLLGLYTKLPDHHRVRTIFMKLVACLGKWLDKQVFVCNRETLVRGMAGNS